MYQDIEGQRPVIVARNHNGRIKPPVDRWTLPPDWSPELNRQWALITGVFSGVATASYLQFYYPVLDLLSFYARPNSWNQLSIFAQQVVRMESFRSGFATSLAFQTSAALSFESSRWWLWRYLAGGYPAPPGGINASVDKPLFTALSIGLVTSWIPVPFYNLSIRYEQDQILPREFARGYRNHLHAAYLIARKDGFFPFFRSAGPIMGEHTAATTGLFFFLDFIKDKIRFYDKYNGDFPGYHPFILQLVPALVATYFSLAMAFPFRALRHYVDEMPKNTKGQKYLASYAEAFWKFLGDTANGLHLWNGFNRYLAKAGPPLLLTILVADTLGLSKQTVFSAGYVPD